MSLKSRHLFRTLHFNKWHWWKLNSQNTATVSVCHKNIHTKVNHEQRMKLETIFVPSLARVFCIGINSKYYSSNRSSFDDSEDEGLCQSFKNDPELKELIKQFQQDFSQSDNTAQTEGDAVIQTEEQSISEEEKKKNYYKIQEQIVEAEIQEMYAGEDPNVYEYETVPQPAPIPLERGQTGVFDIGEVVQLLKSENATDVCVLELPTELAYVDHMVIATGRSARQILAIARYIKKLYKMKRASSDPASVRIEGQESKSWIAMDLGNIAVHLFLEETREMYDLETLWSVGPEYDDLTQMREETLDPWTALLKEHEFIEVEEAGTRTDKSQVISDTEEVLDVEYTENIESTESPSGWQEIPKDGSQKPG